MEEIFERLIRDAEHAAFSGWDFSWVRGRMVEEPRAWDYAAIVRKAMPGARAMLDIGTGGGERLAAMAPLPPETFATEGYAPNVPVARARLAPLGVQVVPTVSDDELPFSDSTFDLVIDRHTGCSAAEVHRVLRPGGHFVTQQVGNRHNRELNVVLEGEEATAPDSPSLDRLQREVEAAGLVVTGSRECFPPTLVLDVGAIVYYLRAIPWVIPGFSADTHRDRLLALHQRILAKGPFRLTGHYLLLEAVRA